MNCFGTFATASPKQITNWSGIEGGDLAHFVHPFVIIRGHPSNRVIGSLPGAEMVSIPDRNPALLIKRAIV